LAGEQIKLAEQLLQGVRLSWAEAHVRIARLLREAGNDPRAPDKAAEAELEAAHAGLGSSVVYVLLALCFHYAVLSDAVMLGGARWRLD
jgi:hypothetical protein